MDRILPPKLWLQAYAGKLRTAVSFQYRNAYGGPGMSRFSSFHRPNVIYVAAELLFAAGVFDPWNHALATLLIQ
jgi:hypothetical protein